MSTPSVSTIAAALETSLKTISGLQTFPYLPDSFTPPAAMVSIDTVEYHGAFANGNVTHTFTVFVVVSRASDRAGISLLEDYMSQSGTNSIRAAIEADPTLGGVVSTTYVDKAGPPAPVNIDQSGVVYLSCPFNVTVHA